MGAPIRAVGMRGGYIVTDFIPEMLYRSFSHPLLSFSDIYVPGAKRRYLFFLPILHHIFNIAMLALYLLFTCWLYAV